MRSTVIKRDSGGVIKNFAVVGIEFTLKSQHIQSWQSLKDKETKCTRRCFDRYLYIHTNLPHIFPLYCPIFNDEWYILLSTWINIEYKILGLTNSSLSQTLFYASALFDAEKSTLIVNANIKYFLFTEYIYWTYIVLI